MRRTLGTVAVLAGWMLLSACNTPPEVPGRGGAPLPAGVQMALLDATHEVVADGFEIPWGIAVIGEEEFLVTERLGMLFHYRDGRAVALEGLPETVTVRDGGLVFGGYMDVSLHPRFEENGLVYLAYVDAEGRMAVARFEFRSRTVRGLGVVFRSNAFSIGSRIAWADDAHFFVTQGQGGAPHPEPGAQDPAHDGGKIHRLTADGAVPPDNPVLAAGAGPTSVWSYGHRDPQGLFFDADEGRLYATEHGPLGGDELNLIVRGGNYGWPLFSYGLNYDGTPVSDRTEAEAARTTVLPVKFWGVAFNMAPSGLERLEGSLFPAWDGRFLMGALAQRRLIAYDVETGRTSILLENVGRVRDVVQVPSGRLLILLDAGSPRRSDRGRVVRLAPRRGLDATGRSG